MFEYAAWLRTEIVAGEGMSPGLAPSANDPEGTLAALALQHVTTRGGREYRIRAVCFDYRFPPHVAKANWQKTAGLDVPVWEMKHTPLPSLVTPHGSPVV